MEEKPGDQFAAFVSPGKRPRASSRAFELMSALVYPYSSRSTSETRERSHSPEASFFWAMASPFFFSPASDRPWPLPGFPFPDALAVGLDFPALGVDDGEEPLGEILTWGSPSDLDVDSGVKEKG